MKPFPRTQIENLSIPRMIIGSNWFMGYSHTSRAKDDYIKQTMTRDKIADVLEVFLAAGIDAYLGLIQQAGAKEAITEAEQRTGKKITIISTPTINIDDTPQGMDEAKRTIAKDAELGAAVCMPHTCSTDRLLDARARVIRNMDKYCAMIRACGMIPGLSTHTPETVVFADETNLDVAAYIQIYNAAGFLMHVEVDWVHRVIWQAKHPVITIKPMAAGRLLPLVGLGFTWATIRPCDMVAVGTMTPDEAKEVIDISWSVLENRSTTFDLQATRSKQTVTRQTDSQPRPAAPPAVTAAR
ncbi:hypothetical protein HQ590_13155 [bacterium]|nr:hypothetical protein [bacterium]